MKTYQEFVREMPAGFFNYAEQTTYQDYSLRKEYEEYCAREREVEAAQNAAKYLEPYNEAVSLFLEYQVGYVDLAQPSIPV